MSVGLSYTEAFKAGEESRTVTRYLGARIHAASKKRLRGRLCFVQAIQKAFAVPILAELVTINTAILFPHIALERAQQIVRGMIQKIGLGLWAALACRFHSLKGRLIGSQIQSPTATPWRRSL